MPSGSKPSRIPVYMLALLLLLFKREAFARSLDTEENATGRRSTRNGIRDDHGKKDSAGDVKEVELVKDYTGWRMLRLFPPSASVLEQVVSSLEVDPEVVILGVFRTPQLAVDVTIPPTKSLEAILSHAHLPSLCSLDGNDAHYLKDSISPSRIARLCNEKSFASGRENPNSKSFLGWRTLDDFLSPGSPRQDNETGKFAFFFLFVFFSHYSS
ncbi:uncharacterized protein LOC122261167 [Penaeus japonicus]|uniref:uncharacterized protein LOC122261167 n=1 Tax=Penaeus japonicus TaxID=27405 RepID=UPI001C70D2DE|nr:uncharacterized protein LOC122261167 [Penaeus japonicus]